MLPADFSIASANFTVKASVSLYLQVHFMPVLSLYHILLYLRVHSVHTLSLNFSCHIVPALPTSAINYLLRFHFYVEASEIENFASLRVIRIHIAVSLYYRTFEPHRPHCASNIEDDRPGLPFALPLLANAQERYGYGKAHGHVGINCYYIATSLYPQYPIFCFPTPQLATLLDTAPL